jgi:16S rRNA processing protein RimM
MPESAPWVAFAKLGRPNGLRGECRFFPYNTRSEAVKTPCTVELRGDAGVLRTKVTAFRKSAGVLVATIDAINTRELAEAWTGAEVFIAPEVFAPLEDGEYYSWELEGMKAVGTDGAALGIVRGLENYGAGDLLLVRIAGREILLPFAEPWVGAIDRSARTVVIVPDDFLV